MYDVVCVGSGLIGGAASSAFRISRILAKKPKVLLIDAARRPYFAPKETKDLRQIAVNTLSRNLLDDIGAWENIEPRAWPVHRMRIGESMGVGGVEFDGKNGEALNYITEAGLISEAVVNSAEKNGVELEFEAKIDELVIPARFNYKIHDTDFVKLTVNDRQIESQFLIGCDGANSMVRQKGGIRSLSRNYEQRGVVATVEIEPNEPNHTAYQRFLADGSILAFLPCGENQVSIVWSCDNHRAASLQKLSPEELTTELNEAMTKDESSSLYRKVHGALYPLGNLMGLKQAKFEAPPVKQILSPVASFPLGSATSDSVGPRFALLGDAAHRVHPMAGQGANMGYRDIDVLLDTIETYYTNGTDPYSELCLEDYQRQINLEHGPMMAGIESLKYIYSQNDPLSSTVRNIGTSLVNSNTALKFMITSRAA